MSKRKIMKFTILTMMSTSLLSTFIACSNKQANKPSNPSKHDLNDIIDKINVEINPNSKNKTIEQLNINDFNFKQLDNKHQVANFSVKKVTNKQIQVTFNIKDLANNRSKFKSINLNFESINDIHKPIVDNLNDLVDQVEVKLINHPKNNLISLVKITDFEFSNYDIANYKIKEKNILINNNAINLSFKLVNKTNNEESKLKTIVFNDFSTKNTLLEQLNQVYNQLNIEFNGDKATTLINNVTKSDFNVNGLNDMYQLEILELDIHNSDIVLKTKLSFKNDLDLFVNKDISISGFLTKELVINQMNSDLANLSIQYKNNIETTLITDVNQNDFTISNFNDNKYTYQVISFLKSNNSVIFKLLITNNQYPSIEITKNLVLSGFKTNKALQNKLNQALNNVEVNFTAQKELYLTNNLTVNNFRFSDLNNNYTIEDVNLIKENGTVRVSFRVKDLEHNLASNIKTITINGFKTNEQFINQLNNKLNDIQVQVNIDKGQTYTKDITWENLVFSNLDNLTIVPVDLIKQDTTIIVKFKIKDLETNLISSDTKTLEINGFKLWVNYQELLNQKLNQSTLVFNKDKSNTLVKEVNINDFELSLNNNENSDYVLNTIEILNQTHNSVSLKYTIKDIANDLVSNFKTITISGFLDYEANNSNLINHLLSKVRIIASNNGYFENNKDNINLNLANVDAKLTNLKYQWYLNNQPIYNETNNNLTITKNQLINNSIVKLKLLINFDNQELTAFTNELNLYPINPLENITLKDNNQGLLVNNSTTLTLENIDLSNIKQITWYQNNQVISNDLSSNLTINSNGNYYAKIINNNDISWTTNLLEISNLKLQNNEVEFRNKLTTELNLQSFSSKILRRYQRTANNQYYETNLEKEYGKYGFKYPGWDNNYESNGNKNRDEYVDNGKRLDYLNSWLKYTDETTHQTKFVNISDLVLNEKNDQNLDYADPNWIKEQIKNNTLKKHPAVKNFYQRNVLDTTSAIDKNIQISSNILGFNSTGAYLPAGEVATITFSDRTYEILKKYYQNNNNDLPFKFIINANYWVNRGFDNSGRISNRYPKIQSEFRYKFSEIDPATKSLKIATPFGGSLTIELTNKLFNDDGSYHTVNLTLSNVVEQLFYSYKQTTKQDWIEQLNKVKSGKISAPVLAIQTDYSSILVPFTAETSIAYVPLDKIIFPEDVFRKWDSFYQMSFAWGGYNGRKIVLNYCNDVWGGAGAWGGNGYLYADTSWASGYLTGNTDFSFANWGNYHEINHNFQDYQDPFNIRDHGWTNIPSVVDLTYINDSSRKRNLLNGSGRWEWGWARLANAYNLANNYNKDWYSLYSFMIYSLGPSNFVKWVQNSARLGHSYKQTNTVKYLSDYFGINFYYALRTYSYMAEHNNKFRINVPKLGTVEDANTTARAIEEFNKATKGYEDANKALEEGKQNIQVEKDKIKAMNLPIMQSIEKNLELNQQLNDLASKQKEALNTLANTKEALRLADLNYPKDKKVVTNIKHIQELPAMDFVANLYAVGNYFYNPKTQRYEYDSDVQAPFLVPAFGEYTFDFNKAIKSINPNFKWSRMRFSPTTKWFGSLKVDPNDNKKLIYIANSNYLDQIDEFDLTIYPDDFDNKPSNYVPGYKFKIKMQNVVNRPSYYIFDQLDQEYRSIDQAISYAKNNNVKSLKLVQDFTLGDGENNYLDKKAKQLTLSKFKFIPPKTGKYTFKGTVDDLAKIYINGTSMWTENHWNDQAKDFFSYDFDVNQVYDIEIWGFNISGAGGVNFWLVNDDKAYNFKDYALVDTIDTSKYTFNQLKSFLTDSKYQYQPRYIDSHDRSELQINKFIPTINAKTKITATVNDTDASSVLDQNNVYTSNEKEVTFKFTLEQPTLLNTVSITRFVDVNKKLTDDNFEVEPEDHDENNSTVTSIKPKDNEQEVVDNEQIPSHYKLTAVDESGNNVTLFDYYASVETLGPSFDISFDQSFKAKYLYLTVDKETPGIKLVNVKFGLAINANAIKPINSSDINFYGNWELKANDKDYGSWVNATSAINNNANNYFETTIKTNSFSIIGKKSPNGSSFDVYLDNKLIGSNISTANSDTILNTLIASFNINDNQEHILKIVNKENKELALNYIAYNKIK
ncbi:hypothetical protein GE118_03140 [Mycoplasma sp. NEAQ87857]|uniref:M60 family metallopeptidase n=1 Tax=Mycoplasma sp. NEAQ87857 TaxID=2683967 RepID=UPI001317D3F3|nr:M60 family metallopeptidase [Mycoplasma sp. NEAQ87857]QGZ97785.1 hypothetical protein GE118_03140 [Mycoplasma sp. NEAQ87857]